MNTVSCLIVEDLEAGGFKGWPVGFHQFEVVGATPDEVEGMLRRDVLKLHASDELVLNSTFVRTFSVELP